MSVANGLEKLSERFNYDEFDWLVRRYGVLYLNKPLITFFVAIEQRRYGK